MKMRCSLIKAIISGTVLLTLGSCRMVSEFLHDEDVVASVGTYNLYRSELNSVIPSGLPQEDSIRLAVQYINNWASGRVFLDMAQKQLSKDELDVSKELDDYRTSLLKYRYEQHFVSERLDTHVTSTQMKEYFDSHKEIFRLRTPIVKARFMRISPESPEFESMRKMLR
ncbi:MAG: hypothetical protein HUJ94_02735, partial [Bacteroidales bacterium]|nr:hypothetical protein [Bacteroidales bacterium]